VSCTRRFNFRHGLPLLLTHRSGLLVRLIRWARREPGLATRMIVVIGCTTVIGVNWLSALAGIYQPRRIGWSIGPISGGPDSLRWLNLMLLFSWGLAAVGFQAAIRRTRRQSGLIRAWPATDVVLATVLLIVDGQVHLGLPGQARPRPGAVDRRGNFMMIDA
jgi:hypothetical protein